MSKRRFLIILFVLAVVPALGIAGFVTLMVYSPAAADLVASATTPQRRDEPVTRERYNSIKTGMTYVDVRDVFERGGRRTSEATTGGTTTAWYTWENSDGAGMRAVFVNGRLETKVVVGRLPGE